MLCMQPLPFLTEGYFIVIRLLQIPTDQKSQLSERGLRCRIGIFGGVVECGMLKDELLTTSKHSKWSTALVAQESRQSTPRPAACHAATLSATLQFNDPLAGARQSLVRVDLHLNHPCA